MTTNAERVGRLLFDAGYRGPISIDSWMYLDAGCRARLRTLGEINARLSFGFVARALAELLVPNRSQIDVELRCGPASPDREGETLLAATPDGSWSATLKIV
ncbi:MAG: hypothetical protein AAF517_16540 [Planctomycetota bacterium]